MALDEQKLNEFIGKFVADLGAVFHAATPLGRIFYSVSTTVCTPASKSQEVGLALGAQAGEARMRDVITSGGFRRFRRAAETPFNLVFEARP